MLPFSYATRNLFRSKTRLLQTIGGSTLVVLLVMAAVAINQGMNHVLSASGSPRNVILVGSGSEESVQRSEVPERAAGIAAASVPGVSEALGVRAVSGEIHYMNYLDFPGHVRTQALIRGVTPEALRVHPEVRLTEGHFPRAGEVMIGRLAWRKLDVPEDSLPIGSRLQLSDQELTVAGKFAAPGTVLESEVWATLGDIRVLAQRDTLSCVVLRLDDPADFPEADLFAKQRLDLELTAMRESDYYGRLSRFFGPLRAMIWITAGLIGAGAVLGGVNTLYAAFASRVREMATLQAIGFSRGTLLLSLIQESLLACLTGTLIASGIAMVFLDGRTVPFSIGAFTVEIDPGVALTGVVTGILLGLLGAIPPAIRCLKPALPTALRMS
ncbi:ABC-type lipoprotein release transport system permease subunit [Haloferula luteola]|uniref:ABC-type lipoprotein release transport system permease subunit n=1 Tax=Haloferula luteola TaxID=595692 RepID=A0A840V881_9BACT|nr:ABC transporter permease [Haloferula luteola]MBB5349979.1 ABC-type lipoprotein release transport system permease subunit [Haloferula luteola]